MSRLDPLPPRVVLRLAGGDGSWAAAARAAHNRAPWAVRALLAGRARIELSGHEAAEALDWARTLPGWEEDGRLVLTAYAPDGAMSALSD